MSDLKLLPPDPPTPLERLLLDAAANEAPSVEQRLRVRQALGLPTAVVVPTAQAGRSAVLVKAVVVAAVVVGAALLFVVWGRGRTAPAPASAPAMAQFAANPPPALRSEAPSPTVEAAPPAPVAAKPPAKSAAGVTHLATESGSDLSEQLRLIETARSAVASGDARAASRALSSYGSQFPHGTFAQEAAVLRIETVDLQGNHTQAAALARGFLARHPNSPHVALVQGIAARAQ
ncbi:MAG TPA: outer membrane protein assembly factor BamD [Polyangiaceae bacterium]